MSTRGHQLGQRWPRAPLCSALLNGVSRTVADYQMFGADRSAMPTGGGRFRYQAHHITLQKVHNHSQHRCYFSM